MIYPRDLRILPLLITSLTAFAAAPAAAADQIRVLSVIGSASAEGGAVRGGQTLAPGAALTVERGAVAQLLINWRTSVSLAGPDTMTLSRDHPGRFTLNTGKQLRLAGGAGEVAIGRYVVALDRGGAAALLHEGRLFVLRGKVHLSRGAAGAKNRKASTWTLTAGQAAALSPVRDPLIGRQAPPARAARSSASYQPPPPWTPGGTEVDLEQVVKARKLTQERQKRQREMASCGCTEGSGGGAGPNQGGTGGSGPTLEKRNTRVRIKIQGLPRKIGN